MQIKQCTASGEEHGLINTLTNSVPFDEFKNMKPATKAKAEKQKKEDARLVKAEYLNSRGKHERLTKPYCRWSGDPIQIYHLIPGKVYEVPVGFINEVNDENKRMKKRSGLVSVDGENLKRDESPLDKDEDGDWLHRMVPVGF